MLSVTWTSCVNLSITFFTISVLASSTDCSLISFFIWIFHRLFLILYSTLLLSILSCLYLKTNYFFYCLILGKNTSTTKFAIFTPWIFDLKIQLKLFSPQINKIVGRNLCKLFAPLMKDSSVWKYIQIVYTSNKLNRCKRRMQIVYPSNKRFYCLETHSNCLRLK